MSRDYKLNKSELTRLKRQEKLYSQYLPVLKLKQEQLQIELNRIKKNLDNANTKRNDDLSMLKPYIQCFCDSLGFFIGDLVKVNEIKTIKKSIAGIDVKTLCSISFKEIHIPYFQCPPWLLLALPILKNYLVSELNVSLLKAENEAIRCELKRATKKVNLFDMVLIPKTKDAIKRIKIALGDEQVASISRGKIAKLKKIKEDHVMPR
jgi:V/A-type H+/Na+-transporting ATPase subunit D